MKRLSLVCMLLVAVGCIAQTNRISEAKTNIEKKHHAAMVAKAERLLKEQSDLEQSLALVRQKIAKVESGEDQEEDSAITSGNLTFSTCSGCFTTYAAVPCCNYVRTR